MNTPENELNSAQRKRLRGMAMMLKPALHIGRQGLSENVLKEANAALAREELIKVRVEAESREARQALLEQLAEITESTICGIVGSTASIYRPHKDPEKRMPV